MARNDALIQEKVDYLAPLFEAGKKPSEIELILANDPDAPFTMKASTIGHYARGWRKDTGQQNPVPAGFRKEAEPQEQGEAAMADPKETPEEATEVVAEAPPVAESEPVVTPDPSVFKEQVDRLCDSNTGLCDRVEEVGETLRKSMTTLADLVTNLPVAPVEAVVEDPPEEAVEEVVEEAPKEPLAAPVPAGTITPSPPTFLQFLSGHMRVCPEDGDCRGPEVIEAVKDIAGQLGLKLVEEVTTDDGPDTGSAAGEPATAEAAPAGESSPGPGGTTPTEELGGEPVTAGAEQPVSTGGDEPTDEREPEPERLGAGKSGWWNF